MSVRLQGIEACVFDAYLHVDSVPALALLLI